MNIDIEKLAKILAENINLKDHPGDIVGIKMVEHEIGNIERGGIGIQIINGVGNREDEEDMNDDENDNQDDNDGEQEEEELNYFAPTNSLQRLLKQPWFAEARSDKRYDTAWTDAFVEALMGSEYGEGIARDWAVQGLREKKSQIKGYVIGLLKDVSVLKGSYREIASKVGIVVNEENKKDPYRTFADYMSRGKKQPYADWVKGYAMGLKRESE